MERQVIPGKDFDWEQAFSDYLQKNKTLAYMMLKNTDDFTNYTALKDKVKGEWVSITWGDFREQITAVAKALLEIGVLEPGDKVGIFSANRAEWAIADLGILAIRAVSVPIYATNSVEEAAHIINDADVKLIFVGNQEQYDKSKTIMAAAPHLQKIVAFDRDIKIKDEKSIYFDELLTIGRRCEQDDKLEEHLNSANPDDTLTLIYTSGTTGPPKGTIHTHHSFMGGIYPATMRFPHVGPEHVSLAILPLSHVFERMWSYGCMSKGVCIAYCPDPKEFVEVMGEIKPHLMTSVPRIWEKVYATIHDGLKTASPIKAGLFKWAERVAIEVYRNQLAGIKSGGFLSAQHRLADKLIMQKARETLGAVNNDVFHVGGASFSEDINEFFFAFGINTIQGFGLTEFFPVAVGFGKYGRPGKCGPVMPMCQVRVSDEGEIQLKGHMSMVGYHNNPEATAECFTEDGWFKTQDIGEISTEIIDGEELSYIAITDRIKDLIITAGGKNISPQQIEMLFGDELLVEQFVTIGEGRSFISALIAPNFVQLEEYCRRNKIDFESHEDLIKNPEVIKLYERIVDERTQSLGRVEKVKKFALLLDELTQEGGELTPTLKLKRKQIAEKYKDIIDKMYAG